MSRPRQPTEPVGSSNRKTGDVGRKDPARGLSLARAYVPKNHKAQEQIVERHACAACDRPGDFVTGDRGPRRKLGDIVYYRVALKCRCGFLNFANVIANDLPEERRRGLPSAQAALNAARDADELPDPLTEELLVRTAAAGFQEDMERARRLAQETVAHAPNHPAAWYNLGWVCTASEDYRGGLEAYTHTLELSAEFPTAWLNMANIHRHLRQHRQALDCYDRFLERYPGHAHARAGREECVQALGKQASSTSAS